MLRFDAYMMVVCFVAVCAAVAYAQFDEEFGDMIGWISRTYHYPNGVQIGCGAYQCERASWTPGLGRDSAAAGLRVSADGQEFGPDDFLSATALSTKGWSLYMQNEEQGRVWMRRQAAGGAWLEAEFERGALTKLYVFGGAPASMSVEGQTIRLPLDRRKMKRTFPAPIKVVRRNAVNGELPD